MNLNHYLICTCGMSAKDEQYLGEFTEDGYRCVECLMRLNQEAVRAYQEKNR